MGGSEPDWYAVLGAGASASQVEIRRLHRQAVKEQHPDRTHHLSETRRAALEAEFIEVTAAWAVLGDPVARAAYDRRCAQDEAQREARREDQRESVRRAAQQRRDEARASRRPSPGGSASSPRVPTARTTAGSPRPAGEDHHEHLAVPEGQLRGGVTVTDSRTGATYGPFHQAGVFRIRAHGGASAAGGPRGHLVLHVTVQGPAAGPRVPDEAASGRWHRWGTALGWRALAAAGAVVFIGQELLPRR